MKSGIGNHCQGDASAERIGSGLAVAANLVWVAQAGLLAHIFASLLEDGQIRALAVAGLFFGLGVVRVVLNIAAQRFLSEAADQRIEELRLSMIAREASTLVPSEHGGAGALAALATEKLEALRPFYLRYKPARLRVMFIPPIILMLTASQSWAVAIVLLLAGPLIPVFMALVGWAAKEASERQMAEIGTLNDVLADRLAALSDLRLIGAQERVLANFIDVSNRLRSRTMAVLRIAFLSSTVLELFAALGVAMVAVWVGFSLLGEISWGAWGDGLSPFAGVFLLLLTPDYFQPLRDLASAWHDRSAAEAVLAELDQWGKEQRPAIIGNGAVAAPLVFRGLETEGIRVSRGRNRLRYPDLKIGLGESIALTGASGAGKTTLLRLLAGLEYPSEGAIRIDGTTLDMENADAWRSAIGWMPQSPQFLNQSLRRNVTFGAPMDQTVMKAAKLEGVVAGLPRGDLTVLGENGAGLSGGETRRVMLARALHRSPTLLIVDEPTADLDQDTAQKIIDSLLGFVADGGTLIAATHDQRLAGRLDRIVDLGRAT